MATRPARRSYSAEMRSAIDTRHQAHGNKPSGTPGSAELVDGAGIGNEQNHVQPGAGSSRGGPQAGHPQNKLAASTSGRDTGAAGGPQVGHPQNKIGAPEGSAAEERGESAAFERREDESAEHGTIDNSVAGPRAVGKPGAPIPHAGRGTDAKSSGSQGGVSPNPLNVVAATGAGQGTDAGSTGAKGGPSPHPQNKVLPVKKARTSAKRPTAPKSGTSNLHVLSKI